MTLEEIYNIFVSLDASDFHEYNEDIYFFKDDVSLSISFKESDKNVFGYDYFFDNNHNPITNNNPTDRLVYELCQLKNFPETYNNISIDTWTVTFNGQPIFDLSYIHIINLSSLRVYIPLTNNSYDFIMGFCYLLNNKKSGAMAVQANQIMDNYLNTESSTFEDFLNYKE
jgi:hypothetical protein